MKRYYKVISSIDQYRPVLTVMSWFSRFSCYVMLTCAAVLPESSPEKEQLYSQLPIVSHQPSFSAKDLGSVDAGCEIRIGPL